MGLSPPSSAYMETRSRELHLGRSRPASSQEVYRRPHFIPERSPDQTPPPPRPRAPLAWTHPGCAETPKLCGRSPSFFNFSFVYLFIFQTKSLPL